MDIFKEKTHGFKWALFLFDNAMSHQKRAPDAPSARKMVKNPKLGWTSRANGPRMRDSVLPDGTFQSFYFPEDHPEMPGWFKGMEVILEERGLWRDGLCAECKDFKCADGAKDCRCRWTLFNQPDFRNVKSHLEEIIEARGHLCEFYPKFHCELNYIEQYWGAVKLLYCSGPRIQKMAEMEQRVAACLDDVPLLKIRRCALCRLIDLEILLKTLFQICKSFCPIYGHIKQRA